MFKILSRKFIFKTKTPTHTLYLHTQTENRTQSDTCILSECLS